MAIFSALQKYSKVFRIIDFSFQLIFSLRRESKLEKMNSDRENIYEKIEVLRKVVIELLDEIKSLGALIKIDIENGIDFEEEVKRIEILLIERALEQAGGSQTRAAKILNLKKTTLGYKIKCYNLKVERYKYSLNINK